MLPKEIQDPVQKWIQENGLFALIIIACVLVALTSLIYFPRDNPIEQAAEKEIESITGVRIDLTP